MQRDDEIEVYVREYREARINAKREQLTNRDSKFELSFLNAMNDLVNKHMLKQREKNDYETKYLFLCYLMSSGYTESYESILGMSNKMLYLDESRSQVFWIPEQIYKNIERDMEEVEKILRKKVLRLQEAELFRIKQKLLKDDWKLLVECWLLLVKKEMSMIINNPIVFEKELVVVCGGYMDRPQIIWHSEVRGCK